MCLLTPRLVSGSTFARIVAIRAAHGAAVPPPAAKQVHLKETSGHFNYARDWSRDKRYSAPQKPGDTPMRFMTRKLGHAYEIYPLFALTGVWLVLFCYTVYYSFEKIEIWLDRSQEKAPWDWERIRTTYFNKPTLVFDKEGVTRKRCELLETLQDEMVAAAKARGTR